MSPVSGLLPKDFHGNSRVWIYLASRAFEDQDLPWIREELNQFALGWTAHGQPVKGFAGLFLNQFLIFLADETRTGISGCSIDSSVREVKMIETRTGIACFDRNQIAFWIDGQIRLVPLDKIEAAFHEGKMGPHSLFFNNLVATKSELDSSWLVEAENSWLKGRIGKSSLHV